MPKYLMLTTLFAIIDNIQMSPKFVRALQIYNQKLAKHRDHALIAFILSQEMEDARI
jgi:hypothetical protein